MSTPFVGTRVTHRCRVFEPGRRVSVNTTSYGCLIALIKIHVTQQDIAGGEGRRVCLYFHRFGVISMRK